MTDPTPVNPLQPTDPYVLHLPWLVFAGAPNDGIGVNGDIYLNASNGDMYQKASGTWGSPRLNIGASGIATITGGSITGPFTLVGTITNSGTVSGGAFSGAILIGGSLAGAITNAGTLNGGTWAGTVTNVGTVSGGTVAGAIVSGGSLTGTIANGGTVSGGAVSPDILQIGEMTVTDGEATDDAVVFQDQYGFVTAEIPAGGGINVAQVTVSGPIAADSIEIDISTQQTVVVGDFKVVNVDDGSDEVLFVDKYGFVTFGLSAAGVPLGVVSDDTGSTGTGYSTAELLSRDAQAVGLSMAVKEQFNASIARPIWEYNLILAYGQSFESGAGTTSELTTTQPYDSVCVGTAVHATSASEDPLDDTWVPRTDAHYHPMLSISSNEPPIIGTINTFRGLYLARKGITADPTRILIGNVAGIPGANIEKLSEGNSPEAFNRIRDLVQAAKDEADLLGKTFGVLAVRFDQGQANAAAEEGIEHSRSGYGALLLELKDDIDAAVNAITGQDKPPAMFVMLTSSSFDGTGDTGAIPMAQYDAADANPTIIIGGPTYQLTNKVGEHPDEDGYRWSGENLGKVLDRIYNVGSGWKPLSVTGAYFRGSEVLLTFHVPVPPLQVLPAYIIDTPTSFTNLGFRLGDDEGSIGIVSIDVFEASIRIKTAKTLDGSLNPWVQYAGDNTFSGVGNIADSDSIELPGTFELTGDVGAHYPANNWLGPCRHNIVDDN